MLLFRGSEAYNNNQPAEVLETLKSKMIGWVIDLSNKGQHVGSEPLERNGRIIDGLKNVVEDGPFGQEPEIIGGCTIIQAGNIDGAVDIAKTCPILETNATIEVRPIQNL